MKFKLGDIVLVNCYPSFGREYKKIRPSLVIQNNEISEQSPYVTVMPMTSKIEKWRTPDVLVLKDLKNRLQKDSVVKVEQISSYDRSRFIRKIGEASSPVLRQVRGYLRRHFQL